MAIAFDAATNAGVVFTTSGMSWNHTCSGANRLLCVGVSIVASDPEPTPSLTAATYNGVSFASAASDFFNYTPNGKEIIFLLRLFNPASGTNTVSLTFGSTFFAAIAGSLSYTGVTSPTDTSNGTNQQGTASYTQSLTTTVVGDWMVWVVRSRAATTSASTGATERFSEGGSFGMYDTNGTVSPGSNSMSVTCTTTTDFQSAMGAFSPASDVLVSSYLPEAPDAIAHPQPTHSGMIPPCYQAPDTVAQAYLRAQRDRWRGRVAA